MNNTPQNKFGVMGEFGWSGYAATYFLVDPINDLSAVLMMQILDAEKNIKKDFYNNIFKNIK
jgi:CubicO group peptidase (beta-lactamase class C family)